MTFSYQQNAFGKLNLNFFCLLASVSYCIVSELYLCSPPFGGLQYISIQSSGNILGLKAAFFCWQAMF